MTAPEPFVWIDNESPSPLTRPDPQAVVRDAPHLAGRSPAELAAIAERRAVEDDADRKWSYRTAALAAQAPPGLGGVKVAAFFIGPWAYFIAASHARVAAAAGNPTTAYTTAVTRWWLIGVAAGFLPWVLLFVGVGVLGAFG